MMPVFLRPTRHNQEVPTLQAKLKPRRLAVNPIACLFLPPRPARPRPYVGHPTHLEFCRCAEAKAANCGRFSQKCPAVCVPSYFIVSVKV